MFIPTRGDLLTSWVRENRSLSLSICGFHSVWKGRRSRGPSGTLRPTPECWLGETEREPWVLPRGWHFGFLHVPLDVLKMSIPLSYVCLAGRSSLQKWQGLRWSRMLLCSCSPCTDSLLPCRAIWAWGGDAGRRERGNKLRQHFVRDAALREVVYYGYCVLSCI